VRTSRAEKARRDSTKIRCLYLSQARASRRLRSRQSARSFSQRFARIKLVSRPKFHHSEASGKNAPDHPLSKKVRRVRRVRPYEKQLGREPPYVKYGRPFFHRLQKSSQDNFAAL